MSRTSLPFHAEDISALARSLNRQLAQFTGNDQPPGHVELLNMLSRAIGCRNYQHFRAQCAALVRLDSPAPQPEPVDPVRVLRLARYFDQRGLLLRWPSKFSHQKPCLWVLWARLPAGQAMTEPQINELLKAGHLFGDHPLLRRELCDYGMVARTPDCREYRRIERRPPPEALALIRHLGKGAGPSPAS